MIEGKGLGKGEDVENWRGRGRMGGGGKGGEGCQGLEGGEEDEEECRWLRGNGKRKEKG